MVIWGSVAGFEALTGLPAVWGPLVAPTAIPIEGSSEVPAIPTMYHHLLAAVRASKGKVNIPESLTYCISGGPPLSHAL
jgi:hypothetical protein